MEITTDTMSGKKQAHLVAVNNSCLLHAEVVTPFSELKAAAAIHGFDLQIISGFRSYERQLLIWNEKASGKRILLDDLSHPLDVSSLTDKQRIFAILRWSALPGCSRHHWGTDMDIWDAAAVPADHQLKLIASEYDPGAPFYDLSCWLRQYSKDFGFEMPYSVDRGGVAREPWHLTYAPLAKRFEEILDLSYVRSTIDVNALALGDAVIEYLDEIFLRFIENPNRING